jgi:hypothetical protein
MLAAFSETARVLDRDDYREVAERNADFLLRELTGEWTFTADVETLY